MIDVQRIVKEFEVALRMMIRDKQTTHIFDLGVGITPETGVKESWSMLIVCAPTKDIEQIVSGQLVLSKPL